jgi:hypothetical protein
MLYKILECDCGEEIAPRRWDLGYRTCLECGEKMAKQRKFTVAIPYSKGAYQLIHDAEDMKHTNPKRTT